MGSLASAGAAFGPRARASANDTVRVACVGVHAQGREHLRRYGAMQNVEIAAICDIDESVLNARVGELEKPGKKRPAAFTDFRKLLEDKSIDAVSIATPNHHHTLQTIWACQAGKDVYVEKPCSHDMFEAKQIVAAAQKYNRLVQHGTNSRSSIVREAVQHLRERPDRRRLHGARTLLQVARHHRPQACRTGARRCPLRPVARSGARSTSSRRTVFTTTGTGSGTTATATSAIRESIRWTSSRWGLGVKYPTKVSAIGGHFMFDDDQETPNTITATFEFDDGGKKKMMVFDVRHRITNHEAGIDEGGKAGNTVGAIFYGSDGYLSVWDEDHGSYQSFLGREQKPGPSGNDMREQLGKFHRRAAHPQT